MKEPDLLYQAGLSRAWVDEFIRESNKIDPHPGSPEPGFILYDGHLAAVIYAIQMAAEDRYAIPHEVHKLILGQDHPMATVLRERDLTIGINPVLKATHVPKMFWTWNRRAQTTIDSLRVVDRTALDFTVSEIWRMHVELMLIHPYELYNGKVGRILMLNHALLLNVDPWIIQCETREDYLDLIRCS